MNIIGMKEFNGEFYVATDEGLFTIDARSRRLVRVVVEPDRIRMPTTRPAKSRRSDFDIGHVE